MIILLTATCLKTWDLRFMAHFLYFCSLRKSFPTTGYTEIMLLYGKEETLSNLFFLTTKDQVTVNTTKYTSTLCSCLAITSKNLERQASVSNLFTHATRNSTVFWPVQQFHPPQENAWFEYWKFLYIDLR